MDELQVGKSRKSRQGAACVDGAENDIRRKLVCTWHAFFARFPHLRPIQLAAIPAILKGKSVVVNAPTAAGKTEAIMAPVIERYIRERRRAAEAPTQTAVVEQAPQPSKSWFDAMGAAKSSQFYSGNRLGNEALGAVKRASKTLGHTDTGVGPAIVLVAPTKALCNDLYRRLREPVEKSGLDIAVRTGDNPTFKLQKPPQVIVTTPESLDSLLARKPAVFKYLSALVIDEIHLLCGSGRGDQLQCLISRLRVLNGHAFQICASSATVPDIQQIARDFLGDSGLVIATESSARQIEATIRTIHSEPNLAIEDTAAIIESMLLESPVRKILAFCNSRTNVENIVHALRSKPRIAAMVFAHHGSLSKEERIRTEQQFLRAQNAACVATSTLELGIDIGDVDRIILLGPPPDVSSLIQRIGRGCRTMQTVYACCLADSPFNSNRFLHLVECARGECLFPDPVSLRPTALVQQALSICLQNPKRWIGKQALYERISPAAQRLYSLEDCEKILENMTSNGLMRKAERGRYVPDAKTEFLFERGYMHSMITERGETDVVDSMTGRTLGSVYLKKSNKDAIAMGGDVRLTLGGTAHSVSYMRDEKIFVKRSEEGSSMGFMALEPPRYSLGLAQSFARFMHVPGDAVYLRCVPQDYDSYANFTPSSGDALRMDVPHPPESLCVDYHVNHFLGTIGACLLQFFFEAQGNAIKKGSFSPFFLRIVRPPSFKRFPDENNLSLLFESYIRAHAGRFARLLQPGPWLNLIPEEAVLRWLLHSIDVHAYARILSDKPVVIL